MVSILTREELRKIFDEAEKKVLNPEVYNKILANLTASEKLPPDNEEKLSIRVNQILIKEIVFEVLLQVLERIPADKEN